MTPISRTLNVMAFEFRNGILKKETIIQTKSYLNFDFHC